MSKKPLAHTSKCSKKKSIVTQTISAKTKAKLKALSKELGVDEEVLWLYRRTWTPKTEILGHFGKGCF